MIYKEWFGLGSSGRHHRLPVIRLTKEEGALFWDERIHTAIALRSVDLCAADFDFHGMIDERPGFVNSVFFVPTLLSSAAAAAGLEMMGASWRRMRGGLKVAHCCVACL